MGIRLDREGYKKVKSVDCCREILCIYHKAESLQNFIEMAPRPFRTNFTIFDFTELKECEVLRPHPLLPVDANLAT